MMHRPWTGWVCLTAALLPLSAATAQTDPQSRAAVALVERFEAARRDHDPVALEKTLAPDFVEISPRGEVDPRDKVLGFYAPDLKQAAPPMESDEIALHTMGDTALVSGRITIVLPGAIGRRSIRALYVAQRAGSRWRLRSAQYTPIPPAPAK